MFDSLLAIVQSGIRPEFSFASPSNCTSEISSVKYQKYQNNVFYLLTNLCINTTKFASLLTTRRQSIRLLNQRYVESRDDHNHRNCVKIHRIKVYGLHFLETVPDKNLIYNINFLTFLQLESESTHLKQQFQI